MFKRLFQSKTENRDASRELYLDLMKRCVTNSIYQDASIINNETCDYDAKRRMTGEDWPSVAHTMIGTKRLDNIQFCIEDVLRRNIPGDLIETGVWRGGATIFMRAILKAYSDTERSVWVADSFQGLPPPRPDYYPQDEGDEHHSVEILRVGLEQVKANFERYGLLDQQVRFLKGWFRDTLPTIPEQQFAVIRLDGDMYESTMDGLVHLYPKLSSGGYVIVDDFGAIPACKKAVEDYRGTCGISTPIISVDWTGRYWMKE